MNLSNSLLLIGCGKMGGAVLNGLLKNGFSAGQIRVAEPNETVRAHLEAKGIACAASASELKDFSPDIVFLAVKPFFNRTGNRRYKTFYRQRRRRFIHYRRTAH